MRAVVTRVKSASVAVDGKTMGAIGQGLLILLGIAPEDTPAHCKKLADKILGLRIFRDDDDKMNRSLADVGGSVLVVSQFTLYGDCRKGRRPSFTGAAVPENRHPALRAVLAGMPRARLSAAARAVRRGYARHLRKQRSRNPDSGHRRTDVTRKGCFYDETAPSYSRPS